MCVSRAIVGKDRRAERWVGALGCVVQVDGVLCLAVMYTYTFIYIHAYYLPRGSGKYVYLYIHTYTIDM